MTPNQVKAVTPTNTTPAARTMTAKRRYLNREDNLIYTYEKVIIEQDEATFCIKQRRRRTTERIAKWLPKEKIVGKTQQRTPTTGGQKLDPLSETLDLLGFGLRESWSEKDDAAVNLQQPEDAGRRHVFTRPNRLKAHKRNLHRQNQTYERRKWQKQ